jgi:hypothetical protein
MEVVVVLADTVAGVNTEQNVSREESVEASERSPAA